MPNKPIKEQVLILLEEAKEQAVKFRNPDNYMYPILIRLVQDAYDLTMNEIQSLYDLNLQPLLLKK
jgi:hypothetical protein